MKYFQRTLLISVAVFLFHCAKKEKHPEDIISREKIEEVLWDMMRADHFLSNYVLGRDTSIDPNSESIRLYRQVLEFHGISKEEFQRSFDYYRAKPALLRDIMDSLSRPRDVAPTEIIPLKDSVQPESSPELIRDTNPPLKKLKRVTGN